MLLLLLVRAVNYTVSCQTFVVIFMAPLAMISSVSEKAESHADSIQLGACCFFDKSGGM